MINPAQQIFDEIVLSRLPKCHAVNHQCSFQLSEPFFIPAQSIRENMRLDPCASGHWIYPERDEVIDSCGPMLSSRVEHDRPRVPYVPTSDLEEGILVLPRNILPYCMALITVDTPLALFKVHWVVW